MIETVGEALTSTEFVTGFRSGTVALVLGVTGALLWRRSAPVTAILWVGTAVVGLLWLEMSRSALVIGLGLLALAGLASPILGRFPWVRLLASAPGAWLVAHQTQLPGPDWVPWLVFGAVVVGAPLSASTDSRLTHPGVGILMWAVSVGGVYGTVPDTEQVLVLLGAVTLLVVLGLVNVTRLGSVGIYPAVGLLAWATAMGGFGRPASIVGGLACLGIFLVAPLADRLRPEALRPWVALLITHVVVVGVASRVAGLRTAVPEAGVIAGAALLLGLVVLLVAGEARVRRLRVRDNGAASS